jgi:hypothetical protein
MISNFVTENRTITVPLFRQKPQFTPVAVAARNVSQPARAITAAPVIRQVSTLYPDARFELVEKDRNNGFLYLFNGRYEAQKAMYLFLSMVTAAAYPTLEQIPIGKKVRGNSAPVKEMTKGDRETINKVLIESFKRRGAVSLTTVKKQASEFRVTLPLFASTGLNLPGITARLSSRAGVTNEELEQFGTGREWPLASLPATGGNYNDKFKAGIASASPVLKFVKLGELDAWVLELTITKGQAEFLTNSSWVEIRPMDLHGLLYEWGLTYYGDLIKATPDYAIPLRQIAKSLDASRTTPRLSEDGLLVTERAEILALPRELDAVRTFEDRYASAYTQPNGAFGALDLENPTAAPRRPPKAMPVLIDWANLKFAYTTQDGRLQTRSLDRSRPVTVTHIVRFLERRVGNDSVRHVLAQTVSVGSKWGFEYLGEIRSITELERAIEIVGKAVDEYKGITEIPLYEVARYALTPMAELPENLHQSFAGTLTSFYALCKAVLERIDAEPETAYAEYSVPTIIELRAFLVIFTKYAKDIRKLRTQDEELRKPYLEQPPETIRPEDLAKYTDPNMPLEAVPFANDSGKQPWGALPHQAKIAHLTASAPPNVILPVATGGGKSSIIIYDILREMGRGSKGPFLILCPSHLVSNYVREFVYFTNSEVNVIPITNYTINRHGYERLQTMIEKAPVNTVLIADFNSIRNKASSIAYGVAPTKVFPAIEFLRQFAPQYVAIDESHYLRNRNARQDAVARLVSDIPKIRLASGTLVANVLLDLVSQFALMDPTLFGTEEDFIKTYAAGSTGNKVIYRDGAEQEVNSALRSSCLFAKAQKKEWAAILPFPLEQIHGVELSKAQKEVYQKIFEQSFIEAIKQDSARFGLLLKRDEDLTDREREERNSLNLDGLMSQCLQRIESFLTAPGEDEGGALELKGDDLISPKVRKIVDLCKTHLEKEIPGKILIFTNYNKSADAIDKALKAAGLGDMSIYYTATEKEKCGADFENNPKKKIMFGIENSMNTGLNLQYCFPGHTQIMTSKNTVMSLKDVFENPNVTEVLSYDLKNRKIEIKPILRKIRTRVKEVDKYVKIGVVDNKTGEQRSMVVTANHKIFMKGGGKLRADELTEGDQLITFGGNFERMRSNPDTDEILSSADWLEVRNRAIACPECGEFITPQSKMKHLAVEHGIGVAEYQALLATKSKNSKHNWSSDREKMLSAVLKGHAAQTHEQRSEYTSKAWANDDGTRRQRMSELATARWQDEDYKEATGNAISEALLKIPEVLSENSKRNWARPEYRERLLEVFSSEEHKQKLRNSTTERHENDASFTLKCLVGMAEGRMSEPSSYEQRVIDLQIDNLKFVGTSHAHCTITLEIDGKRVLKNPDFISENHLDEDGQPLRVVEVVGGRKWTNRFAEHDKKLIAAYKNAGIKCLVIGEEDFADLETVEAKLQSFVNNHYLTVRWVRNYTNTNVIGDFKYDIEVEGNHNYFALAGNEDLARQSRKGIPVLVSNCSRLIRCETVWTPGVLEQGNARIGRPNLKVEESRPYVYYDWVVALDTLDVTKISYLISKTISAAKFSEAGNERFDDIEVPPLFPMTLENIQNMNSWQETLPEYISAYQAYQKATEAEYADYRERAKDYLFDADGKRRMAKVSRAANPPGSALIRRVPYHPGTELYGQDQLGLVRYDQFLRQQGFNVAAEDDEFAEDSGAETPSADGGSKGRLSPEKREQLLRENALVGGMWAHTEFGDGQIENLSVSTIKVRLDSSGELVSVDRLNCFLITRAETSSKDIRTQVLKLRGQVPLDAPIEVLESQLTPAKMKMLERERRQADQDAYQQQEEEQASTEFEFRFSIVNDWLSIILVNSDNDTAVSVVQQSGFKYSPEYFYAEMRTPKMLFDQFQAWFDAGLEIPADYTDHLTEVYKRFKSNGKKGVTSFMGIAKELEIRNFYKVEFKPDADANTIRPFPLIQDDILYIALPSKGHPGSKNAMRHKVPGVTWYKEEEGAALAAYTKTRNNAVTFFEHIESLGYTISNKADLIAELRTLKTIPAKPSK